MSDFFSKLGFPPPEERDSIRFYFSKGLTYRARRNLILGFMVAGLAVQVVMLKLFPGLLFLLVAVILGLVKGYDSRVRLKNFKNDETWTEVSIEKFREIESIRQKSIRWDRDSLDITNVLGCFTLLMLVAAGFVICLLAGVVAGNRTVTVIMFVDFLVLVLPFYFTGVRWALKQGNLSVKIKLLLKLHEYFNQHKIDSESFIPMMLLARESEHKSVPVDVKFQIRYKGLPSDRFYGLQCTVNINLVQGTSYPYFYCVLVAKPGFGLAGYEASVKRSEHVMCERQEQPDAEVLVIRNPTSKTSGYVTDEKACIEILSSAMGAARLIESDCKKAQQPRN